MQELASIGVLDGTDEADFHEIVLLVARMMACEVSLLSIIDLVADRQVFKAQVGLQEPWSALRQTPLSHSFCRTVVVDGDAVRVPDARVDSRFRDNPAITDLGVIAYLGLPVEAAPGEPIGALCAISSAPRNWTDGEVELMRTLAAAVSAQIRIRLALHDQRQLSADLETTNQRFHDLAANVPGAIFRYRLFPDGTDSVEYMSPGCLSIWEVSAEEVTAKPALLWEIIVPEDVPGMQASIGRSAEHLANWQHRWRVVTRTGQMKWLQGYGQPRRLDDGSILWNSLILDVTVEVQAQEKLRQNDRMLAEYQRQEIIGRLAGGVAHDFNNLLAIIMGNAEFLLDGNPSEPPETYLTDIVNAAQRGSDLTRSLLSFARRSDLKPQPIDVNEAVAAMHKLARRTVPESIAIKVSLMGGLWQVLADRSALESALLNLVVNARDAMPNGGTLTIETANINIGEDYIVARSEEITPGRYVMLAVTDTGTGIPPDVLERVFEPFFTTKGNEKGSGLGLAMVQGFAKQSEGMVRIYSELGHGTSVKLYLRALEETVEIVDAAPELASHSGAGRVLLVDDNEAVRRTLRSTLESAGYEVFEAASGDAAFVLLEDIRDGFDIVLTDVVMPGQLQGPDLVRSIRARLPDMPAVFMSGYPHEANVHGNGIRDSDVSLMKPFSRTDLLGALDQTLRRQGTMASRA